MTIESEITKLNTNLTNSYTACSNKGATLPASQNFDNLASTISAIPAGTTPTLASLTVTPSTTAQTITPPSGTDGYNTVIASAVTASIDSDIVAGNIKSGVSILGVSGTVTALAGETRTVSITSTSGNTFTPSSGKNGITSIKCNPTNKALTITPSKTSQTKTVPSGYSGYGTVTCNAVTSSIDSNITAGNIKSGVSILGVTGTYEGSGGGTQIIVADSWRAEFYDEHYDTVVEPSSSSSDSILKLVFNASGILESMFFETRDGDDALINIIVYNGVRYAVAMAITNVYDEDNAIYISDEYDEPEGAWAKLEYVDEGRLPYFLGGIAHFYVDWSNPEMSEE